MKPKFAVVICLILVSTFGFADEAEEIRSWTNSAAETLIESARVLYMQGLIEKGLAESDAEALLQTYATNSAECLAKAIRSVSEQENVPFKSLVRQESSGYINLALLNNYEFKKIAEVCTLTALENAGISTNTQQPGQALH